MERAAVAGRMALGWSSLVLMLGVLLMVALPLIGPDRSYCENIDHPGPCESRAELALPGLAISAVGAACVAVSVALLRGRAWGRWAVAITFALWALVPLNSLVRSVDEAMGWNEAATAVGFLAYFVTTAALAVDWGRR